MSISVKERRALERAIDRRVMAAINYTGRSHTSDKSFMSAMRFNDKSIDEIKALLDKLQEPEEKR